MAASNTFGGKALFDALAIRQDRSRYHYDEVPELEYANAFWMSGGRWPSRGWILLRREDYDALDKYAVHDLIIQDFGHRKATTVNPALTLKNLVIVQGRCVTRGVAAHKNAIYLVELTDQRGVIWNRWSQFPTQSQYNIRAPAYPELFYSASMNGGSAWTFTEMIGNLWAQMTAFLGAYPGLPITPAWTPEGWSFPGTPAWTALCDVLEYLGLTITVDLTQASPFGIAALGGADAGNAARFTTYNGVLEDDWEYIDTGLGRVPKYVQVLFHRRNQYYGTEETVRRDSFQWSTTPLYAVTVAGPYTSATGTAILWADATVQFDVDGAPLAASVTDANTIASALAGYYFNRIMRSTQGFMKRQYVGALPFTVGGLVDGVCWRQDQRAGNERKGWVTEVVRGPEPPFSQVKYGCP